MRARAPMPSYYMHILVKQVRAPLARRSRADGLKQNSFSFLNAFYSSVQMVTTSQLYTCRAGSTLVKEKIKKKSTSKKKKKKSFRSWAFTSWFFGIERANAQNGATRIRARARVGRYPPSIYIFTLFIRRARPCLKLTAHFAHWRIARAFCSIGRAVVFKKMVQKKVQKTSAETSGGAIARIATERNVRYAFSFAFFGSTLGSLSSAFFFRKKKKSFCQIGPRSS
jgi:hypothetical protein